MTQFRQAVLLTPDGKARFERIELPELGPSQVRVRMLAMPVHPADLNMIQGVYPVKPGSPPILGIEGVGEIEKTGIAVSHFKPGQWVVFPAVVGTWASVVHVDASALTAVPPGLPLEQAAMSVVNPTTAWRMLKDFVSLKPGDWVAQNVANSAVGRYVIRLARHWRLKTLNLVRRPELVEELKAEGATEVLVVGEGDLREQVQASTGGAPVQLGLNGAGGAYLRALTQVVSEGATLVTYGAMAREPFRLSNGDLIFRDLKARGFWVTRWFRSSTASSRQELFSEIFPLIRSGQLSSPVEARFPLEDVETALESAQREKRQGKILFIPS